MEKEHARHGVWLVGDCFEVMAGVDNQKDRLVCTTSLLRKGHHLVETTQPIVFHFESSHMGLTYTQDAYPWLQIDAETNSLHGDTIEPELQRLMQMVRDRFEHAQLRDVACGGLCMNGGCYKCGLHVQTLAALHSVCIRDFIDQSVCTHDPETRAWTQFLTVDEQYIIDRMQLLEVVMVVDFIKKCARATEMLDMLQKLSMGHSELHLQQYMRSFVLYVWHCVGIWKTHGVVSHMQQPIDAAYMSYRESEDIFARDASAKLHLLSMQFDYKYTFEDMELVRKVIAHQDIRPGKFISHVMLFKTCHLSKPTQNPSGMENVRRCQIACNDFAFPYDCFHSLQVIRDIKAGDFMFICHVSLDTAHGIYSYFMSNPDISFMGLAIADNSGDYSGVIAHFAQTVPGLLAPYIFDILVLCHTMHHAQ